MPTLCCWRRNGGGQGPRGATANNSAGVTDQCDLRGDAGTDRVWELEQEGATILRTKEEMGGKWGKLKKNAISWSVQIIPISGNIYSFLENKNDRISSMNSPTPEFLHFRVAMCLNFPIEKHQNHLKTKIP